MMIDTTVAELQETEYRQFLKGRYDRITQRAERLREQIAAARKDLETLDIERGHLAALLELMSPTPDGQARESRASDMAGSVADFVVDLLQEIGHPMHFREIAEELFARGWAVPSGSDPANTLLAKYFNDPRLYRPRRGTYAPQPEGRQVESVGRRR